MLDYKRRASALLRSTDGESTRLVRFPYSFSVTRGALKSIEMTTTEKFYSPVDGILHMFNSLTGHHQTRVTHQLGTTLQHPKVSSLSKAGMGIIKTLKGCWRQQEKRVSEGKASTDRLPKRSVEVQIKPRNCHRIVVLGAPKVGKSNIIQRFLGKEFEENYEPTVEDFHRKLFYIRGETYQIDVLDAASERDFPAKRRLSILTGDIFLLVFSLDDRNSLNEACELLNEIKDAQAKLQKFKHPQIVPAVICGNKADLDAQRVVTRSEVGDVLGEDVTFFETSAKNGTGLNDVFGALAALGGLPSQMSPWQHQIISILTYQSLCVRRGGRRGSHTRGLGAPCAAVVPLARRPSFTSDLRRVLGSSTTHNKPEKCQIQ